LVHCHGKWRSIGGLRVQIPALAALSANLRPRVAKRILKKDLQPGKKRLPESASLDATTLKFICFDA